MILSVLGRLSGLALLAAVWQADAAPAPLCSTHATPPSCTSPQTGPEVAVDAPAGQWQRWEMDGGSHAYAISLFGPDGTLLRYWPGAHNGTQDLAWVTPAAGVYRLQAQLLDFETAPAPRWTLRQQTPAAPAAGCAGDAAHTRLQSPALQQLHKQLAQADAAQATALMSAFWQDIQTRGAPLLEATAHPDEVLVTFLWRAPSGTEDQPHCVTLDWAMRSESSVDLQPLPGSDLWHASVMLPRGAKLSYQLVVDPQLPAAAPHAVGSREQRMQGRAVATQRDTLNPQRWHAGAAGLDAAGPAALHAQRSVLEIPQDGELRNVARDLPSQALTEGTLHHWRFHSALMQDERSLSLYLPKGNQAPGSLPLLVLFDREPYLARTRIDAQLDQWIRQRLVPPMAMLLVSNPSRAARGQELPPDHPAFGRMLTAELLPSIRHRYPQLTQQAAQTVVAGSSYGGLAAGWLGWSHPEVFGKVLSLSGSYWWGPSDGAARWAERDWVIRQIAQGPLKPVRWFLSYGLLERGVQGAGGIVDNNRHLRNVLQAKGYPVTTHEYGGGHDYYVWGDEILLGLQTLLETGPR